MQNLDPTYLRYIYDGLIKGSVHSENESELPDGLIGLYEEAFEEHLPVLQRQQLLQRFALFALIKKEVSVAFVSEVLGESEKDTLEFINTYASWFNCPEPGKFQLYHERLKVFVLQKLSEKEIQKIHEKLISHLEKAIEEQKTDEFERYALEFLSEHLTVEAFRDETKGKKLLDFTKKETLWDRQIRISNKFDWSRKGLHQAALWTSKYDQEENIDCYLDLVQIHNKEQNDAENIVRLVANNEIDLALERITAFGGPSKEEKERQFILFMLCLMELTLLESKTQPWRKEAIQKLLKHLEEEIPVDHSLVNWGEFFSSKLMFNIIKEIEIINCLDIIYKRTSKFDLDWLINYRKLTKTEFKLIRKIIKIIEYKKKNIMMMYDSENFQIVNRLYQNYKFNLSLDESINLIKLLHNSKCKLQLLFKIYYDNLSKQNFSNCEIVLIIISQTISSNIIENLHIKERYLTKLNIENERLGQIINLKNEKINNGEFNLTINYNKVIIESKCYKDNYEFVDHKIFNNSNYLNLDSTDKVKLLEFIINELNSNGYYSKTEVIIEEYIKILSSISDIYFINTAIENIIIINTDNSYFFDNYAIKLAELIKKENELKDIVYGQICEIYATNGNSIYINYLDNLIYQFSVDKATYNYCMYLLENNYTNEIPFFYNKIQSINKQYKYKSEILVKKYLDKEEIKSFEILKPIIKQNQIDELSLNPTEKKHNPNIYLLEISKISKTKKQFEYFYNVIVNSLKDIKDDLYKFEIIGEFFKFNSNFIKSDTILHSLKKTKTRKKYGEYINLRLLNHNIEHISNVEIKNYFNELKDPVCVESGKLILLKNGKLKYKFKEIVNFLFAIYSDNDLHSQELKILINYIIEEKFTKSTIEELKYVNLSNKNYFRNLYINSLLINNLNSKSSQKIKIRFLKYINKNINKIISVNKDNFRDRSNFKLFLMNVIDISNTIDHDILDENIKRIILGKLKQEKFHLDIFDVGNYFYNNNYFDELNFVLNKLNASKIQLFWFQRGELDFDDLGFNNCFKQLIFLKQSSLFSKSDLSVYYLKGISNSINIHNISDINILNLFFLLKNDGFELSNILTTLTLKNIFLNSNYPQEKIEKFNRVLDLQWAIDLKKELDQLPN